MAWSKDMADVFVGLAHPSQAVETPLASGRWEMILNIKDDKNQVKQILEGCEVDLHMDLEEYGELRS